ncbi:MAPEG family protein [Sphingosinicella sp. CPCC 101087]|uniref:MAPEG family protein n=1 Tax=Sphingosinicella sp. CPCC 101087 TaxID=2497754 RepID=UPI00101CFDBB|nr:MAPEG family protein [Sphingosinicella sp. CPCC 101087]
MTLHATAAVTLLALLVYFGMAVQVARTRTMLGILPPAMTGDARLERTLRAHANTLEWLAIFLPSLWLFAVYWGDLPAALIGLVWIAGRIAYFLGYVGAVHRRFPGFFIQSIASAVLLFGALGRAIFLAVTQG